MMILDVGCGCKPRINATVHTDKKRLKYMKDFVRCDNHYLPFQDKVFERVYCSHSLEHCLNPTQVLTEFQRICSRMVEIRVPDAGYQFKEQRNHLYSWTKNTFYNLMSIFFEDVTIKSNLRIHGSDTIQMFKVEGLIRLLRMVTKHELVGVGYVNG